MFFAVVQLFSGISIFLYGLKTISKGAETFIVNMKTQTFSSFVKKPIKGALLGGAVAGITQSSVAVSFITVGLVDLGVISFVNSVPIIMGANVGTTVTAQLVSLSGASGVFIGALSSIIGLLVGFSKNKLAISLSDALFGLAFIFVGLSIIDREILALVEVVWLKNLFLINRPLVLVLNGLVITAIVQSSSAVTGIMIILAGKGLVTFKSAVFLTLGANVGSCFSVVFASLNKSLPARRASVFNLVFNCLGAMIFLPIALFCSDFLCSLFVKGNIGVKRAIANFHTVFNLLCAIVFLPFYRLLAKMIANIVKENANNGKEITINKTFTSKSRRFY